MKKYIYIGIATSLLLFNSCTKDDDVVDDTNNDQVEEVEEVPVELTETQQKITDAVMAYPTETLDEGELEGLMKMREEEKLARDVYEYLYNKYETKIFTNIMQAEETHMFAVKVMIDKYNLEDPADNSPAGVFKSSELQDVYDMLIAKGNTSLTDAFVVGTIIEDLDIYDLNTLLESTSNEDLKYVYENLNAGSRNHLKAFYPQLLRNGGEYTPQYLTQEEFDTILASDKEYGSW